jgi:glycosyltransferase involved in cell wall biosynthesis
MRAIRGEFVRAQLPEISVVIAARNEETAIANTLQSLLAQPGVIEIIVVDDHSDDSTVDIINNTSLAHPEVRLIRASSVPCGWTGKTHALHLGAVEATAEFILFTDADVEFSGRIISEVAERMQREHLDHVGGMFGIDCQTIAEKISAPILASFGYMSMSITAARVGSGTGAFNMVRQSAYWAAGGHSSISDKLVDDVSLARLMRKYTSNTLFLSSTSKYVRVRLFVGWSGYWNAIARSSIPFLSGSRLLAIALSIPFLCMALIVCIMPLFAVKELFLGVYLDSLHHTAIGILLMALFMLGALHIYRTKTNCDSHFSWVILYPIPFLLMVLCVLYTSIRLLVKPSTIWRGRTYYLR